MRGNITGYLDLAGVTADADQEEKELLGLFGSQRTADKMIMILEGEALRLVPKSALWARVRADQMVQEQEQRDEARECSRLEHCREASRARRQFAADRKRKRRENKTRAAMLCGAMIAAAGITAACAEAGMMMAGTAILALVGVAVLLGNVPREVTG